MISWSGKQQQQRINPHQIDVNTSFRDNEGTLRDPVDPRNNNDDEEDDEDADADLEAAARRNDDDDDGDDGDIFDEDDEIDNARKKLDEESFDIFGEDE